MTCCESLYVESTLPIQSYDIVMSLFTASAKRAMDGRVNHYFKSVNVFAMKLEQIRQIKSTCL